MIPDEAGSCPPHSYSASLQDRAGGGEPRLVGTSPGARLTAERIRGRYPVTVNDPAETAFAEQEVTAPFGRDRVEPAEFPITGAEDSFVLEGVPGAFVFSRLPAGPAARPRPADRSAVAIFDDAALARAPRCTPTWRCAGGDSPWADEAIGTGVGCERRPRIGRSLSVVAASMASPGGRVSAREAEVLSALGEHLTNAEIGARLFISIRTVESHVSSLLRKLQAEDRRALAAIAARMFTRRASGPAIRRPASGALPPPSAR